MVFPQRNRKERERETETESGKTATQEPAIQALKPSISAELIPPGVAWLPTP